jgi:mono/diheme cytochrome c family protein
MKLIKVVFSLIFLVQLSLPMQAHAVSDTEGKSAEVSSHVYRGYTLFRTWCARCHGTFGQGLAGPNLADSLKTLSYSEYLQVLNEGKNTMPSFSANPAIISGKDAIYDYLKARSDGSLGAVTPHKK